MGDAHQLRNENARVERSALRRREQDAAGDSTRCAVVRTSWSSTSSRAAARYPGTRMSWTGDATGRTERLCGRRVGRRVECEDGRNGERVGLNAAEKKAESKRTPRATSPPCTPFWGHMHFKRARAVPPPAQAWLQLSSPSGRVLPRARLTQCRGAGVSGRPCGASGRRAPARGGGGWCRRRRSAVDAHAGSECVRHGGARAPLTLLARRYGAAELGVFRAVVRAVPIAALVDSPLEFFLGQPGTRGERMQASGESKRRSGAAQAATSGRLGDSARESTRTRKCDATTTRHNCARLAQVRIYPSFPASVFLVHFAAPLYSAQPSCLHPR